MNTTEYAEFTAKRIANATGSHSFCVEHSSGMLVAGPLSWPEAVRERDRLNAEVAAVA